MATVGHAIIDFGATPTDSASLVITGQAGILAASFVEAWLDGTQAATVDHSSDEHIYAEIDVRCQNIVPATGFTIVARARGPYMMYGQWNVSWVWS